MRYIELKIGDKVITNQVKIENTLRSEGFYWLIDSEIEKSKIEIRNKTLIWNDGIYYSGNWHYGIFKSGVFFGKWENGIFENGEFKGTWKSGINKLI